MDNSFYPVKEVKIFADYTKKYGLGYTLSDNSHGVYFNDSTSIFQSVSSQNEGIFITNKEKTLINFNDFPEALRKKCLLFNQFKKYLNARILKSKFPDIFLRRQSTEELYISSWKIANKAILFKFNDGMMQVNFNDDSRLFISSD